MDDNLIDMQLNGIDEVIKINAERLIDIFCRPCSHGNTIDRNRLVGVMPNGFIATGGDH